MDGFDAASENIVAHLERHAGPVRHLYHEPITSSLSDGGVPMEILHVPPTDGRRFHSLVTLGMSRQEMNVPEGAEEYRFAELTLCLPEKWDVSSLPAVIETANELTWPLLHLISLSQAIHRLGSYLLWGVPVPNGPDASSLQQFADGVPFFGSFIWHPRLFGKSFESLVVDDRVTIRFLSVLCLFEVEVQQMLRRSSTEFAETVDKFGDCEVADPGRESIFSTGSTEDGFSELGAAPSG